MFRIIGFCIFLSSFFTVQSQQNITFQDSFDQQSGKWFFGNVDDENVTRNVEGGKFYIHQKRPASTYWTLISLYSDPEKPFSLESNMIQTEVNTNNGFGFIIQGKDNKGFYFLINPASQTFFVASEINGTWKNFNPPNESNVWSSSTAIRPKDQTNNLKVQVANGKVRFLVNDIEILVSETSPDLSDMLMIDYLGIVTCTSMKIEVEDFTFRQEISPVNVVPGLPTLTKVNLGQNVNSSYTEKQPYIAPDGKTLYYVVKGDPQNAGDEKYDDIYYSVALSDSTWDVRQNMGLPLNNNWPNCVITATADNNTLFLMHTYKSDGTPKAAGFSVTTKTANGWAVPTDVKVDNYYNKGEYNEFCFSSDRKILLMGVKRDDSFGKNDIYVSLLKPDGSYTEPRNLGKTVNTFAQESSPFLAADGITLYYATAGLPGFGNSDIYMTRRLDSTWVHWSDPQNMGPDINSSSWEAYYSVPASGKYAYVISSNGGTDGSTDLFRIKLPESLKPRPVVLVYGRVLNTKTKDPLESKINYNILSTNHEVGLASSAPKDGTYKIVLPAGETYSFLASRSGFYSVSDNIDLSKVTFYQEIERDLYLAPLEIGEIVRLNNLFFDFNKSNLRNESFGELERVIRLLIENPTMAIEIAGHTDNVGDDVVNNKLSKDRAKAVETFLEAKGINTERIVSRGYGKSKPVAPNKTDEGRQKNRRVEFLILKN